MILTPLPTLPPPLSCLPECIFVRTQEHSNDIPRIWPKDVGILGLSDQDKDLIDIHIKQAFRSLSQGEEVNCHRRVLTYLDPTESIESKGMITVELPISIHLAKRSEDSSPDTVVLILKTVLFKGGERRIKLSYNLTTGQFLAKKRIVGPFETNVMKHMWAHRTQEDIPPIWRKIGKKIEGSITDVKIKRQVFEPLREGNLVTLFGTTLFAEFSDRCNLARDLLYELNKLHQLVITNAVYIIDKEKIDLPSYKAFHGDLSMYNILVYRRSSKPTAELCDFGNACSNLTQHFSTSGYTAPEFARYVYENRLGPKNSKRDFERNLKHAQKEDLWRMGLILIAILTGKMERLNYSIGNNSCDVAIPPFKFLHSLIKPSDRSLCLDIGLYELSQRWVNMEIDRLQQELKKEICEQETYLQESFDAYFNVARALLKVNPDDRQDLKTLLVDLKIII